MSAWSFEFPDDLLYKIEDCAYQLTKLLADDTIYVTIVEKCNKFFIVVHPRTQFIVKAITLPWHNVEVSYLVLKHKPRTVLEGYELYYYYRKLEPKLHKFGVLPDPATL